MRRENVSREGFTLITLDQKLGAFHQGKELTPDQLKLARGKVADAKKK